MGVPSNMTIDSDLSGSVGSVLSGTLGAIGPLTIAGIPSSFDMSIEKLPKIHLGLDPVTIEPLTLNLAIKEIPSMRTHLPADFTVGFSLLGMELMCIRLCGEAQMINEPYHPNVCERCGPEDVTLTLRPLPIKP